MNTIRAAMPPELRSARSWRDRSRLWERVASRWLWFISRRLHTVRFWLMETANRLHPAIILVMQTRHRIEERGHQRLMAELTGWRAEYDASHDSH